MDESDSKLTLLEDKVSNIEETAGISNLDTETLNKLIEGSLSIVGVSDDGRVIELSDGTSCEIYSESTSSIFLSVDYLADKEMLKIVMSDGQEILLPVINTFYLKIPDFVSEAPVAPGETLTYEVEMSDVADAVFHVPQGWVATLTETQMQITPSADILPGKAVVSLTIVSKQGMMRVMKLKFTVTKTYDPSLCKIYNDFALETEQNILLDFSYAGYDHGESAPSEVSALGWKIYDVTDYGAVADDNVSDREAFLKCLAAATKSEYKEQATNVTVGNKSNANAVIYFPEGEYILHTAADDYIDEKGKVCSRAIQIVANNIVIKGAGRDKTIIVMQDPNQPEDPDELYSSPPMIQIKHTTDRSELTPVTANSPKGSFSVTVENTSAMKEGDWVCLSMQNNDIACVNAEFGNVDRKNHMTAIVESGVKVMDYHQIRQISGNVVTFYEPLMHEVDIQYTGFSGTGQHNWRINKWPHLENVGVEDITFKGNAKAEFQHHGDFDFDGGYKPVLLMRTVNSWVRRVRFTSISEGVTVNASANASVYDVEFDGNRGHAAVRSQASSRVFIGVVNDRSTDLEGNIEGQWHGCGVSKTALGTVLWRNIYGGDSCFESHCEQPRATLVDCCEGGFKHDRAGGAANNHPHHLWDLVLWNYNVTALKPGESFRDFYSSNNWMFPPIVVGFHGEDVSLVNVMVDDSHGTPVGPESLYEAQLKNRLGYVPSWLNSLKSL